MAVDTPVAPHPMGREARRTRLAVIVVLALAFAAGFVAQAWWMSRPAAKAAGERRP